MHPAIHHTQQTTAVNITCSLKTFVNNLLESAIKNEKETF